MPKIVRIATLIFLVCTIAGISNVSQVSDIKRYIEEDNHYLSNTYEYEDAFGKSEGIAIIIGTDKPGGIFDSGYVSSVKSTEDFLGALPYSYRIETLTNQDIILSDNDEVRVDSFISYYRSTIHREFAVKEIQTMDSIRHRLVNPSMDHSVAYATFNLPDESRMQAITALRSEVLEYVHALRAETGYSVSVTGSVFLESEIVHVANSDSALLFPAALFLSALFIYLVFKSFHIFLYTQLIILVTCASVLGISGFAGISISNVSSTFSLIVVMITTVNLLHIFSSLGKHATNNSDFTVAVESAFSYNLYPISLTCLTTVVGFLSLCFLTSPEFPNLGILAASGCVLSLVYTYILLPPVVKHFPLSISQSSIAVEDLIARAVRFAINKRSILIAGLVVVLALGAPGVMRIVPNNDPSKYFSDQSEAGIGQSALRNDLGYDKTIKVVIHTDDGIFEPDFVSGLFQLQEALNAQFGIINTSSYVEMLRRVHDKLDAGAAFSPALMSREKLHQYAFLYEMSLGYGRDMRDYFDFSATRVQLDLRVGELDNVAMLALADAIEELSLRYLPGADISIAGLDMAFALSGQRTISDMMTGVLFTVTVLCAILLLVTRSLKLTLVGMLANIVPAFIVYAFKGHFNEQLSIAGLATITVVLGIIVDDTLHIIVNYKRQLNKGSSEVRAISESLPQTAVPIFVSTIIFSSMLFLFCLSDFNENAQIGILGAPIILIAFFFDVLIMPSLIAALAGTRQLERQNA